MILATTIPIDLASGGRLEIDVDLCCVWCPSEGDGWNEPWIEGHYELDWHRVTGVTWYHPTGAFTTIETPVGSIAYEWLALFLDKRSVLLTEAMEQLLTERV